jgi:hypothetical protein
MTSMRFTLESRSILIFALILVAAGCKSAPHAEAQHFQIGWRPIGKWSGRGDWQTESFNIESTQWRIKWETKGAASRGAPQARRTDPDNPCRRQARGARYRSSLA